MFCWIRYISLFIFIMFVMTGCGSDRNDSEVINYDVELAKGWQEYEAGNYKSAVLAFEKVLRDDAPVEIVSDSYNGLGWSYMNISQSVNVNLSNLNIAIAKFRKSIEKNEKNYDAMVGLATALLIKHSSESDYREALGMIDKAIYEDCIYLYRHDYRSKADLYALKAQCYYYLGEFDNAKFATEKSLENDGSNKTAMLIKKLLY